VRYTFLKSKTTKHNGSEVYPLSSDEIAATVARVFQAVPLTDPDLTVTVQNLAVVETSVGTRIGRPCIRKQVGICKTYILYIICNSYSVYSMYVFTYVCCKHFRRYASKENQKTVVCLVKDVSALALC